MEIEIRGSGPNCTITLGAENAAERHQIAALRRQARDPRTRADVLDRPGSILVLRLETLPPPPEPTYCATPAPVDGLCPRDNSACESAGDGTRCCAERQPFTTDPRLIGE